MCTAGVVYTQHDTVACVPCQNLKKLDKKKAQEELKKLAKTMGPMEVDLTEAEEMMLASWPENEPLPIEVKMPHIHDMNICPKCGGFGKIGSPLNPKKCDHCEGEGMVEVIVPDLMPSYQSGPSYVQAAPPGIAEIIEAYREGILELTDKLGIELNNFLAPLDWKERPKYMHVEVDLAPSFTKMGSVEAIHKMFFEPTVTYTVKK